MQSEAARSLFTRRCIREPAFIGREALIETVWALESAYGLSSRVAPVILGPLEAEEIVVEAA